MAQSAKWNARCFGNVMLSNFENCSFNVPDSFILFAFNSNQCENHGEFKYIYWKYMCIDRFLLFVIFQMQCLLRLWTIFPHSKAVRMNEEGKKHTKTNYSWKNKVRWVRKMTIFSRFKTCIHQCHWWLTSNGWVHFHPSHPSPSSDHRSNDGKQRININIIKIESRKKATYMWMHKSFQRWLTAIGILFANVDRTIPTE